MVASPFLKGLGEFLPCPLVIVLQGPFSRGWDLCFNQGSLSVDHHRSGNCTNIYAFSLKQRISPSALSSQVFWLHKLSNIVTSGPSISPPDSDDLLTIATDHCRSSPLITTLVFSPIMGTTSTLSQKAQCTPGFYHHHTIIPSHVIVSSSLTVSSTVNPALQKNLFSFSKMSLYSLVHSVLP